MVMTIEDVEGSFKLNQNKSEADYAAIAGALGSQQGAGSREIARLMRETRPEVFATETPEKNTAATLEGNV
jgi:transcriptional regulator